MPFYDLVKLPNRQRSTTRKRQKPPSNTLTSDEHFQFLLEKTLENVAKSKLVDSGLRKRNSKRQRIKELLTKTLIPRTTKLNRVCMGSLMVNHLIHMQQMSGYLVQHATDGFMKHVMKTMDCMMTIFSCVRIAVNRHTDETLFNHCANYFCNIIFQATVIFGGMH